MVIMNLPLPDRMVEEQMRRQEMQRIETLLLRGLEAPTSEWTKEDANNLKNAIREHLVARHNSYLRMA
jgi:hypothetical protein